MKIKVLYKILPVLLLAFYNVLSGYAFSSGTLQSSLVSRDYYYLQESQNTQALFFEEVKISISFQDTKRNLFPGFGFQSGFSGLFAPYQPFTKSNNSNYLQDKRTLLEHQIFPFHFFW